MYLLLSVGVLSASAQNAPQTTPAHYIVVPPTQGQITFASGETLNGAIRVTRSVGDMQVVYNDSLTMALSQVRRFATEYGHFVVRAGQERAAGVETVDYSLLHRLYKGPLSLYERVDTRWSGPRRYRAMTLEQSLERAAYFQKEAESVWELNAPNLQHAFEDDPEAHRRIRSALRWDRVTNGALLLGAGVTLYGGFTSFRIGAPSDRVGGGNGGVDFQASPALFTGLGLLVSTLVVRRISRAKLRAAIRQYCTP